MTRSTGLFLAAGLAIAAGLLCAPAYADSGQLRLLSEILLTLAMAQMWNLLAGYTGLVSMGHQAFVGAGAYLLFFTSDKLGIAPYFLVPLAGVGAAVLAAVVAPLMFRLKDAYFSIGMWVFAEIVRLAVTKLEFLGGESGLPLNAVRLVNPDTFQTTAFLISAAICLVALVGVYALMRSSFGLGLMTVRDNELAATSIGVDVWRNRFIAFVITAFGCGMAGATQYMGTMFLAPDSAFDINWVVTFMFIVIIGGIGTIEGPVLGALIYFGLRELFGSYLSISGGWYLVTMGCVAIVVMLVAPKGLWGWARSRWDIGLDIQRRPSATTAAARSGAVGSAMLSSVEQTAK